MIYLNLLHQLEEVPQLNPIPNITLITTAYSKTTNTKEYKIQKDK